MVQYWVAGTGICCNAMVNELHIVIEVMMQYWVASTDMLQCK